MVQLSDRQQTTVSAAITILAAFVIVAAVAAIFYVLAKFVAAFANVFLPLAVAAVAALVFRPYYEWLTDRAKLGPKLAVGAVFLTAILPLVAMGWFFGALIVEQLTDLFEKIPGWWQAGLAQIQERWPRVQELMDGPYSQELQKQIEQNSGDLVRGVQLLGAALFDAGAGILSWVVGLLG
ncbi:MAG: AI-2E family transporter, partial [Holophagales bacterium]|nr:AI-2E family transporter [Holophagales bacterium]